MAKPSVQSFVEGRNAWRLGISGLFIRFKGIIGTAIITLLTMGTPFWVPADWGSKVTIDLKVVFFTAVIGVGVLLTAGLAYLRFRTIRSLDTKYFLHRLVHDIRDKQTSLIQDLENPSAYDRKRFRDDMLAMVNQAVENIAEYFRLQTGDNTISVAIRLTSEDPETKEVMYRTYTRSKGLNPQREKTTESIPSSVGIPKYLSGNGSTGVLIYNDLNDAATNRTYYRTENDVAYPDDIKTMMVAPLNGWSGDEESMIGLLYVCSRNRNVFGPIYVDAIGFCADLLATTISNSLCIAMEKLEKQSPTVEAGHGTPA